MASAPASAPAARPVVPVFLFLIVAVLFLSAAALYSPWLLARLDPDPTTSTWISVVPRIRRSLALCGLAAGAIALALSVVPALRRLAGRSAFQKLTLLLCFAVAPVVLLEMTLAPFVEPEETKTTLYVRDAELGWRHRPDTADVWDGQLVRINGKGLRGPELSYDRQPGVARILYLGDSVTFGDGVASEHDTFPYVTATLLEARLGRRVETVNAGVSGYSPWQEAIYLKREGVRYRPDLVVLTFVLNDVTEKFELPRFGGTSPGWQLQHSYASRLERMLDHSSVALAARRVAGRLRFGRDVRAGARQWENLKVESLVQAPDREDVRYAWQATLREVDEIIALCGENRLPLVLVVSPVLFQMEDPARLNAPQSTIAGHVARRGVPVLDLLPPLAEQMKREGRPALDYFLDSNHYTPRGARVVASVLAEFLAAQGPRFGLEPAAR